MVRLTHKKTSIGTGKPHHITNFQLLMNPAGGAATRHAANIELNFTACRRRAGNRERTSLLLARHHQIDVLPGLKLQLLWRIQRDPDALDRWRQINQSRHLALVVMHQQVARIGFVIDLGFNRDIRLQRGAARQSLAFFTFVIHQRKVGGHPVIDLPVGDDDLARRAQAVTTGVRQVDARPQGGIEDGLTLLDFQHLAQWLNGELIAHRLRRTLSCTNR